MPFSKLQLPASIFVEALLLYAAPEWMKHLPKQANP